MFSSAIKLSSPLGLMSPKILKRISPKTPSLTTLLRLRSYSSTGLQSDLVFMSCLWTPILGQEDPLEEGMATHSSILAWRTPWIEERGGLQRDTTERLTRSLFFSYLDKEVTSSRLLVKVGWAMLKRPCWWLCFSLSLFFNQVGWLGMLGGTPNSSTFAFSTLGFFSFSFFQVWFFFFFFVLKHPACFMDSNLVG